MNIGAVYANMESKPDCTAGSVSMYGRDPRGAKPKMTANSIITGSKEVYLNNNLRVSYRNMK